MCVTVKNPFVRGSDGRWSSFRFKEPDFSYSGPDDFYKKKRKRERTIRKQVGVFVTMERYLSIQRDAARDKISMGEYVRRLILPEIKKLPEVAGFHAPKGKKGIGRRLSEISLTLHKDDYFKLVAHANSLDKTLGLVLNEWVN